MIETIWEAVWPCLKLALGIVGTTAVILVALFCNSLTKRLRQRLEIEEQVKKDDLLNTIVTDAVRTVEEEAKMAAKLTSKGKEDRAVEIVVEEAERKGLGNPIPEIVIRQKIRAKVNQIYNS